MLIEKHEAPPRRCACGLGDAVFADTFALKRREVRATDVFVAWPQPSYVLRQTS